MNTRKLYAICPISRSRNLKSVSAKTVVNKLRKLRLDNKIEISHLLSDDNIRFKSKLKQFLDANGIDYKKQWINYKDGKVYPFHSYLNILNRVVKTFQKWITAYQIDVTDHEGLKRDIQKLVHMYNKSIHRGLSAMIGVPVTPNDVTRISSAKTFWYTTCKNIICS